MAKNNFCVARLVQKVRAEPITEYIYPLDPYILKRGKALNTLLLQVIQRKRNNG